MTIGADLEGHDAAEREAVPHHDGAVVLPVAFAATPLPVFGPLAGPDGPAGIALAFATGAEHMDGGDRFDLLVVDAEGEVLTRLGPFLEDDVVAVWRDLALRSGLPRMILREGGGLSVVCPQLGRVTLGTTRHRRRHGLLNGRRPRFLTRRKPARLPTRPQVHRGESEIIART